MSNLDAFLTTIAESEGTQPIGDRGYDCIVGSTVAKPHLFTSYADHPRVVVDLGHGLKSTAAGRYQILARIYDAYKAQLHLPNFAPEAQDKLATQLIIERHAMDDVLAGRFEAAILKCATAWASLPGNTTYGQHQNSLVDLREVYTQVGGTLA